MSEHFDKLFDKFYDQNVIQLRNELNKCKPGEYYKRNLLIELIKHKSPRIIYHANPDIRSVQSPSIPTVTIDNDDPLDELIACNENDPQTDATKHSDEKIDTKFTTELEKDSANNKLMERLNSELDFRTAQDKKKHRVIAKPYHDNSNDTQLMSRTYDGGELYNIGLNDIPNDDFSSTRLIKKS